MTVVASFLVLKIYLFLHQCILSEQIVRTEAHLFRPRPAYRMGGAQAKGSKTRGENPPSGVVLRYYLDEMPDSSTTAFRIMEQDGTVIETFTPKSEESEMPVAMGMNELVWDMRYEDAEKFDGLILWGGGLSGPEAVPGRYQARLVVGSDSMTVPFEILKDPRSSATQADLQAQYDFLIEIRDKLTETHRGIKQIREVREQVSAITSHLDDDQAGADTLKAAGKVLNEKLTAVEEALYQTKNQSRQDPLNFPIRLNNKLSAVGSTASTGDYRPTEQAYAVKDKVTAQIDAELAMLRTLLQTDVAQFNALVREYAVPAIVVMQNEEEDAVGTR